MCEKIFYKCVIYNRNRDVYTGLNRSHLRLNFSKCDFKITKEHTCDRLFDATMQLDSCKYHDKCPNQLRNQ